ncbi:Ras-specific guanine nucleotide-releasing factor RalGPS1 [Fasciola hepatica]|uniref:Ras-specific guanine nucleotide-releasing factor RalGPS1 n=1 Tax=Fasciola hepatica TaxID=6192 RepID=A0A4E0R3W4_FASHE|nr:Ras-specific guanine nucleotide-releasing factor RalGPS1 [Fasciola hepatica]
MMEYVRSNGTYQLLSPVDDVELSSLTDDVAIADITKGSPDAFAKQITLIELSLFKAIRREEFASLKWNGKEKYIYAPNIVASTRWFNQINFWVQKEILKYSCVSKRTEILSFFIKIAKKLVDYNNLYSAMSIISALQVECIYRLRHTWAGLGNKDRSTYRRLEELFSQDDNCRRQREHMNAISLPGIPYLGLYLSDLTYTNVAFPRVGGKPSATWINKINDIIDVIAHFQQSEYNFPVDGTLNAYLCAQRYIEELQKFLEEDNYKTSLMLEPPPPPPAPPPSSTTETYPHCVPPAVKEDQHRKPSGFLGSLSGDSNSRGLPALTASFHGLNFRSPSSGTNASSSINSTLTGPKSQQTTLSPNAKAASINSSFESDQTPPPLKAHCVQHYHHQSASFSSSPPLNIMAVKDARIISSAACSLMITEPLTETPSSLPSTPISRITKRPEKNSVGKQLFPEFQGPDITVNLNYEKPEPPHCSNPEVPTDMTIARSPSNNVPPVPPRPTHSEDSSVVCSPTAKEPNELDDTTLSLSTTKCSSGYRTPATPFSGAPDPDLVMSSTDAMHFVHAPIPALIESTAVAACAATASTALPNHLLFIKSHPALGDETLESDSNALTASISPHTYPPSVDSQSSFTMFSGVLHSLPGEFTVHIVHQGVVQRRSMTQMRPTPSGLVSLLSPKMKKPTSVTDPDIYGSASSLSTCSVVADVSDNTSVIHAAWIHSRPAGFSTWRRLWATLVLVGQGSAAFMIYFEPKCKHAMHRNQFHAHQCQVQSLIDLQTLYHSFSSNTSLRASDETSVPPRSSSDPAPRPDVLDTETVDLLAGEISTLNRSGSHRIPLPNSSFRSLNPCHHATAQLALGRHRDGSLDPFSFLLTDPGRNKVYRFRPLSPGKSTHPGTTFARVTAGPFQWLRRSTVTRMPGSTSIRQPTESTVGAPSPFNFNTFGRPRGASVPGMFTSPQFSPSNRRAATLKLTRTTARRDQQPDLVLPDEPLGPDLLVTDWMRAIQRALDQVEQFHKRQLFVYYAGQHRPTRKNTV